MPQKRDPSEALSNSKQKKGHQRPETKAKPTRLADQAAVNVKPSFSTFKQFNRTASLSDLINEDEVVLDHHVVKPEVIKRAANRKTVDNFVDNAAAIQLETASLASVNVCVPEPVLPPTKSITVQTDEVDLNLVQTTRSDPLRISTEPLNEAETGVNAEISLSTSFDSMDDTKSKSTDVSMEDALLQAASAASKDEDDDEEDLPTPPATPPIEERLKSPVSTTSRSPPTPTQGMTPTRKVATDWEEYEDEATGRKFYVNTCTKERSWKPPRKPRQSECMLLFF